MVSANGLSEIETEKPTQLLHALTSWAVEHQIDLEGLTVARATLEETYLRLTREAEAEAAATATEADAGRGRRRRRPPGPVPTS